MVTLPSPRPKAVASSPDGFRAVLKNRLFVALWIGQILSQLGDRIVFVTFVAMITHMFGAADRYTSFLYVAFTIPAILLTAIAGVFVDRWPRRAVLVTTNVIRGLLVGLLPVAAHASIHAMYALAFLISATTQFFVPAEAATIPAIVSKNQLLTANSLFTTTMMASVIFGFALGDPLISQFSLAQVHWPLMGLFLFASLALSFVRIPPQLERPALSTTQTNVRSFFKEIQEGVSYIRSHEMVFLAMRHLAVLFSVIVALCILFIGFSKTYLYTDPEVAARKFSYIITSSGIGMVLGAGLVGRFFRQKPRGWQVEGGLTSIGLCLVLLAAIGWFIPQGPPLPLVHNQLLHFTWTGRILYTYLLSIVMGISAAFVAIPLQSMIHELIPEDKRGKVLGVQFTLLSTASTFPVLIAGLGTEQFGVQTMMMTLGLLILAIGITGLFKRFHFQQATDESAVNW